MNFDDSSVIANLQNTFDEALILARDYEKKSPVQAKILLKNYYDRLVSYSNKFVLDESIKAQKKIDLYLSFLSKFRQLLNTLPSLSIQMKLDFNSLNNFFKLNLASLHYNSEYLQGYSNASFLMDMLVEPVQRLDTLPELPSVQNIQEFSNAFVSLLNYLQTSFGVYQTLITNMKIIHQSDLLDWSENALWFFMQTHKLLVEKSDIQGLLATGKFKKMDIFYDNLLSYMGILRDMGTILPTLTAMLHKKISQIRPNILFNTHTLKEFSTVQQSIEIYVKNLLTIVKNGLTEGLINPNDHIEDRPFYSDYVIDTLQSTWLLLQYQFYTQVENLHDCTVELVDSNIQAGEAVLTQIMQQIGTVDDLLESYYLNPYLSAFENLLLFYSLKALLASDVQILKTAIERHNPIISKIQTNAILFLHENLARLFVYTRLQQPIDIAVVFSETYSNLANLQLYPRDYLASIILLVNLAPLLSNIDIDIDTLFSMGRNFGMINEQSALHEEFEAYKRHIHDPMYTVATERQQIIPFDPVSILLPDFTHYYQEKGIPVRTYLPFNRRCDMIQ